MISKIIFLILLTTIFFISCDNNIPEVSIKIIPISKTISNNYSSLGLKSFEVNVFKGTEKVNESGCKDYPKENKVGFNLDSDTYHFVFYGYKTPCSETTKDAVYNWVGYSEYKVVSTEMNNIKIPISKVNEFILTSINMQQPSAFMTANLFKNKIILSGGISNINKNLKRIDSTQVCHQTDEHCICSFDSNDNPTNCHKIVSVTNCETQGMSKNDCETCLTVLNNKFNSTNSECLIASCPLNDIGYPCNLKGRNLIQEIDINNLSSDLLHNKDGIVKMSENRIFHKSVDFNNSLYFIGGAPEARLSNRPPFISYIKYSGDLGKRNMIDVYDDGIISLLELNNININFNIAQTNNSLYILNGQKTDEKIGENSFFDNIVQCDSKNCSLSNKMNPFPSIGSSISKINNYFYILGGINKNTNKYTQLNVSTDLEITQIANLNTPPSLYNPKTFTNGNNIYIIGGFKTEGSISNHNFKIKNKFNNHIYIYDTNTISTDDNEVSPSFQNTVFYTITPYTYKNKEGLLFIGGLKRDSLGKLNASSDVSFMSFDTLVFDDTLPKLKKARFGHSTIIDKDGQRVWVIGGLIDDGNGNFVVDNSIEIFTPSSN